MSSTAAKPFIGTSFGEEVDILVPGAAGLKVFLIQTVMSERGYPVREMGILESPRGEDEPAVMKGALCRECGNYTVIRKDGCDFCSACGWVGVCG